MKQNYAPEEGIPLFPGMELIPLRLAPGTPLPGSTSPRTLCIHYCRAGQALWKDSAGDAFVLRPGGFAVSGAGEWDAVTGAPEEYEGLLLRVDLMQAAQSPPDALAGTGLLEQTLPEAFCREESPRSFAGTPLTEAIFSGFYPMDDPFALPRQKIKALELLLQLAQTAPPPPDSGYRREQLEAVRQIHEHLLLHMEQRVTIEALSRQYLINPTTLKTTFKAVYGNSIAAHIKEHRMERAAVLLKETELSIAQVAQAVGYDSQSRFTTAFKAFFGVLPKDYRKGEGTPRKLPDCPPAS